ncbi:RNA 2',3'-cyclic phosphodiesterase [Thioclava electrotropha]|uniref:RNA 2',3'-cyclic phosphodiesterase n=1 Tax=Thioclava electrotropha TaxID=1549850 RepID=A0ABX6YUU3_9RHOB|nr:RNA 2',3'-cyclic phosphodiesterase [Thioclava electrotropha]QPZ91493.1 RNA 2',3'-cyclic phosphodiesterase [Thioclava electrotropha]
MRSFVAIELPEAHVEAIERLQQALGAGRIVQPENLHLTLAFLDEIDAGQLEALDEGLRAIDWAPGPEVVLAGLEIFGSAARPEALVLGVQADPNLDRWHRAVMGAARLAEIDLPRRRFRPHVTLSRFGKRASPGDLLRLGRLMAAEGAVKLPAFTPEQVALIQSTLGHGPPRHDVLMRYPDEKSVQFAKT